MNWTLLLSEIFESGMTQIAVGDACGCSQSTISDLYTGVTKKPNFEIGEKLVKLHATRTCSHKVTHNRRSTDKGAS